MPNTLNFADGFDSWSTVNDMAAAVPGIATASWDTVSFANGFLAAASTRFGTGQALNLYSSNVAGQKAVTNNDQWHHIAFAVYLSSVSSGNTNTQVSVKLMDGTSVQCVAGIGQDGTIRLYTGNFTTLLLTTPKLFSVNTWTHVEFEICVSSTAGAMNVRLNGNTANDYTSATTLNTRTSSNNYAQTLNIGTSTTGQNTYIDDLIWGSGAVSGIWYSDSRIIQLLPTGDAQAQFTPLVATLTYSPIVWNTNYGNNITNGNLLSTRKMVCPFAGTITAVTVGFEYAYGNAVKMAILDWSGANPGNVLATTGAASTTSSTSTMQVIPLSSPLTVTAGQVVCIAINLSTSNQYTSSETGSGAACLYYATPYASAFSAANTTATVTNTAPLVSYLVYNPAPNASQVAQAQEDGDTTYVYGTTAGTQDLYNLAGLPYVPATIHGVVTKVMSRKDNSGAKTMRVRMKSGSTTSDSTTYALSTTYQYASRIDQNDPNTSAAWLASGIGALQIGPGIVS